MTKKILVDPKTLRLLLDRVSETAAITHSRYDRKTRKYHWDDELFKRCDPYEYKLYAKLRASFPAA